jgi:hypothetical protein
MEPIRFQIRFLEKDTFNSNSSFDFLIKLGFALVLGDPILCLFGIRIEIKSNEGVYNK